MKAIMRDEREMICINTPEVKAIPINWTMTNLQNLFYIKAGGDAKPEYYVEKQDKEHPYPVYTNSKDAYSTYAYTSIPIFEGNTITVSGRGAIGQAFYREKPYDAIIRLLSLSPKLKIEPKYYTYWINNVTQILSYSTVIGQLSAQQLAPYKAAVPSLHEQQLIAHYLDDRCSKIDTIIAEAKASIEEYKELKQAVITDTVCHGIKKYDSYKSYNELFIFEIPSHWRICKVKNVAFYVSDGAHVSPETDEGKYDFISTVNLQNGKINFEGCLQTSEESYAQLVKNGCKPEFNDVLISKDGTVGKTTIINYQRDFVVASSLVIIRPKTEVISPYYLQYNLQADFVQKRLQLLLSGTALKRVSVEKNSNLPIILPSLKEQNEIVDYLDKKVVQIDNLISEKQSLIADLESYKKSLIYEVVTGKRKVVA